MVLKPIIPREHGAWAVLLVPLIIGTHLGGGFGWSVFFFGLSSLGVFLSYLPAQALLRSVLRGTRDREKLIVAGKWTAIYLTAGIVFILPILVFGGRWLLFPIGIVGIGCFLLNFLLTRRQPKTILSDLAAVLGVTLTGPSAYYIGRGQLDVTALVLWLLNILFFASCVFYVHMRIQALAVRRIEWNLRDRITCCGLNLVYHVMMIVILLFLVLERLMPSLALLAFVPITINAAWGTLKFASETDFRILGFTLLGHSVAFMALLILSLR
jgi:hypothetical protein